MVGKVHAPVSRSQLAFGVFLSGGLLEVTLGSQLVPWELALFHCLPILLGVAEGQPRAWFSSL